MLFKLTNTTTQPSILKSKLREIIKETTTFMQRVYAHYPGMTLIHRGEMYKFLLQSKRLGKKSGQQKLVTKYKSRKQEVRCNDCEKINETSVVLSTGSISV